MLQSFVSMENTHLLIRGLCQWKNNILLTETGLVTYLLHCWQAVHYGPFSY